MASVQPSFLLSLIQDIDTLFQEQAEEPQTVDYGEWKDRVGELERILDQEDGKFDPKSDIEKEYANLEKLAQETKVEQMYPYLISYLKCVL